MNNENYSIQFTERELKILMEAISLMNCKYCYFKQDCSNLTSDCLQIWTKIQNNLKNTFSQKKS